MIGETIAHYRITAKLGEGGMGEVYRATDTTLNRDVAIKVLPEIFATDPDRMARFQREAEVLASLNHPNIAHIYGLEGASNTRCIVMELVEGETLQERLQRGPIAIEEALRIAMQIAEALEAAHERGIIHRDLKPANIKLAPDGKVKVLDFGLAKASEPNATNTALSNSPTVVGRSIPGILIGTAAYMSPEQASGKAADRRIDIWSFGVVLWEMLTGKSLFDGGETVSHILADVLRAPIDLAKLPTSTPSAIRELLKRCLDRDVKNRLRDIGEARVAIATYLANPPRGDDNAQAASLRGHNRIPWLLAAVGMLTALAVSFIHFSEVPPQKTVLRYTIAAPENTTDLHSFAISPDGRYIAIAAEVKGKRQLWLRTLDALQFQSMPFTEDAMYPFWSPDSRYIGFFAQGRLKKIAAAGGPAQTLCDAPDGRGGSWNREGEIVFSPSGLVGNAIQRVSAGGGVPVAITRTKGEHRFPVFLPDGRSFLYAATLESPETDGVYLASLDGKENRRILKDQSTVVYSAGRILFVRENTLMAQPFDAVSGQAQGEVFPVAEGVSLTSSRTPVTVSETGVLLYERSSVAGRGKQFVWYDRAGTVLGVVGDPGDVFDPAISPDGKSVVYRRNIPTTSDLWIRDLVRGGEQRLTTDASFNFAPYWSPKSDRIVFASNRHSGILNLYQRLAFGSAQDEPLLANESNKVPTQWSPDGRFLVYRQSDMQGKWDIWTLPLDGSTERKPSRFFHSEFNSLFGQLSPDSHWLAYTSDESGHREVYVRPFPAAEGQWQISIVGGEQPRWRGDGKELFFFGADSQITAVTVKATPGTKPSFERSSPQPLFEAHLAQAAASVLPEYDVTADGKRFLIDTAGGDSASAPFLNVVVNWDTGSRK
jgi:serine/threonine protein kinase/Tol biopolymer transport system component